MLRDTDAYSATLKGAQPEGRGEISPALFKLHKSILMSCVHLKFVIQNVVLRLSRTNISKMFHCGPSSSCVFDEMFIKVS